MLLNITWIELRPKRPKIEAAGRVEARRVNNIIFNMIMISFKHNLYVITKTLMKSQAIRRLLQLYNDMLICRRSSKTFSRLLSATGAKTVIIS